MSVLNRIRKRLERSHPDLQYTEADGMITVHAPVRGGFDVWITEDLVVGCDGWHEHFDAEDEALDCFTFGLSDQCRLKVTLRGSFECSWTLESLEDGEWIAQSTTGLLFFPFWRARRVEYRHNASVKSR